MFRLKLTPLRIALVVIVAFAIIWWQGVFRLPYSVIGAFSKTSSLLLGAIWVTVMAFAVKIADITESPALTPEEHRKLEEKSQWAVIRVWLVAGGNVIAATALLTPSVLVDGKTPVYEWMMAIAGAGMGFMVFTIGLTSWWQEELRRFRSGLRLREREQKKLEDLKVEIESGKEVLSDDVKAAMSALNKVGTWANPNIPH
jgi:hypothetical protein